MESTPQRRETSPSSPTPVVDDNERILSALFVDVQKPLYAVLLQLVRDHETALVIANETLVTVWRKRNKFDPTKSKEQQIAWILAFAPRVAIDYGRKAAAKKRGMRRTQSLSAASDASHSDDPPARDRSPVDQMLADELHEQLLAAIEQLSERDKQLALLKLSGKSHEEIGAIVNLRGKTVDVAMHRMYKRLAQKLAAYAA